MNLPKPALFTLIIIIGFLSSSTIYFFNKSRAQETKNKTDSATFSADLPQLTGSAQSQKVDELTLPAEPKGRLSYPANVYTVAPKETLFGIASKFGLSWQLVKLANGITNENLVQAGYTLVIPKVEPTTDLYRITFKLNEDKASELNRDLRDKDDDASFHPIEVAKRDAVTYFSVAVTDEFTLLELDESRSTALVQAKSANEVIVVGLFQPKEKGKKGFWAILYIEQRK